MTGKHSNEAHTSNEQAPSVDELRAELSETVAALAAKADVPTRVHDSASASVEKAKTTAESNPGIVAALAAAAIGAVIAYVVVRRRKSRRGALR